MMNVRRKSLINGTLVLAAALTSASALAATSNPSISLTGSDGAHTSLSADALKSDLSNLSSLGKTGLSKSSDGLQSLGNMLKQDFKDGRGDVSNARADALGNLKSHTQSAVNDTINFVKDHDNTSDRLPGLSQLSLNSSSH